MTEYAYDVVRVTKQNERDVAVGLDACCTVLPDGRRQFSSVLVPPSGPRQTAEARELGWRGKWRKLSGQHSVGTSDMAECGRHGQRQVTVRIPGLRDLRRESGVGRMSAVRAAGPVVVRVGPAAAVRLQSAAAGAVPERLSGQSPAATPAPAARHAAIPTPAAPAFLHPCT